MLRTVLNVCDGWVGGGWLRPFFMFSLSLDQAEQKIMNMVPLSQAKKSECGIAHPSSCIAAVFNKVYARTTARSMYIN